MNTTSQPTDGAVSTATNINELTWLAIFRHYLPFFSRNANTQQKHDTAIELALKKADQWIDIEPATALRESAQNWILQNPIEASRYVVQNCFAEVIGLLS